MEQLQSSKTETESFALDKSNQKQTSRLLSDLNNF